MITSAQKLLMARAGVVSSNTVSYVSDTGRQNIQATGTLTLPAGIEAGDLVIVASMGDTIRPNFPTGYTLGQQGSLLSVGYMWAYKVMPSPVDTEATGLSNFSGVTHMAIAFRGSSSTPTVLTPPSVNALSLGMPDPPSVSADNGNMVVCFGYLDDTSSPAQNDFLAPTGYAFGGASSGVACSVMGAYLAVTESDTYDPDAFSGWTTNQPSVGATLVLA